MNSPLAFQEKTKLAFQEKNKVFASTVRTALHRHVPTKRQTRQQTRWDDSVVRGGVLIPAPNEQ